jgi:RHS repeat-associated protein
MQRLYNKSFSDSGRISFDSTVQSDFVFYGLGNTRVTFKDATSCSASDHQFDVVSMHDYYPFGKVLRAFTQESERYLTTQHPRDSETDWDYRGARFYDGDIDRFLGVDPHAESYTSTSPYAYVANNPINAFIGLLAT